MPKLTANTNGYNEWTISSPGYTGDWNNVPAGTSMVLSADRSYSPYIFNYWTVTREGGGQTVTAYNGDNPVHFIMADGDMSFTLNCKRPSITILGLQTGWTTSTYYATDKNTPISPSAVDANKNVCVQAIGDVQSTGYAFDHWTVTSGSTSRSSFDNPITLTAAQTTSKDLDSDVSLQLTFKQVYFYTTTSSNSSGGTAVSTGQGYAASGEEVQVIANPNTGYEFDHWTYTGSSGTRTSTANPLTLSMPAYNVDFVAYFKKKTYTVSISGETGGNPTFSDGTSTKTVEHGAKVSFSANPSSGYILKEWVVSGSQSISSKNETISNYAITANTTITAKYQKQTCTVSVSAESGGTAKFNDNTYTKTVEYGSQVTIVAVPNTNYKFLQWNFDNGSSSTSATYTFTVNRTPISAVALFEEDTPTPTYKVTINQTGTHVSSTTITAGSRTKTQQGSVYSNVLSGIEEGTSVRLQAIPYDGGYSFQRWTISGLSSSYITDTRNPYPFTMPANNVSVWMSISNDHAISFSDDAHLTATISGNDVTVMFTGTCTDSGGDSIVYKLYKGTSQISNETFQFVSGYTITESDNCKATVTLTESEMAETSIVFKVTATCSVFSGSTTHSNSLSINFNPQSGSGEPGGDDPGGDNPGGDEPGGDEPSSGGIVNDGYGLYYWNGTEWVGLILI